MKKKPKLSGTTAMKARGLHPVTVYLPPDLIAAIDSQAATMDAERGAWSRSEMTVWLIRRGIEKIAIPDEPAVGCKSCSGYGFFTDSGNPTTDRRCRKCLDCNGT